MRLHTGLSKWVRQLVQHHDTFSNAMQSLVVFSREQQKVEVVPADTRTSSSTAPSPNDHPFVTVEGPGALRAPESCFPASCVKTSEPQQDAARSEHNFSSHVQLKNNQDEKSGEMTKKYHLFRGSKHYMFICLRGE